MRPIRAAHPRSAKYVISPRVLLPKMTSGAIPPGATTWDTAIFMYWLGLCQTRLHGET